MKKSEYELNPWTTLKIKEVYDNPWINVTHRDVLNPSGQNGIYGRVHFKNAAVGIIPLDENYNTWIVGQYRYTIEKYSWEMPEGGGPLAENPIITAKRELLEETGIIAKKWTKIIEIYTSNSVTDEIGIAYVAQDLKFGNPQPEACEKLEIKKLPFTDVVEMIMKGEITDAFTVAAILKTDMLIKRNSIVRVKK